MGKVIQKYAAGGVVYHKGKVLTIKHLVRNSVEFPKGHIENNETKEQTALREVFEETGYKAKIIKPLGDITFEYDWDDGKRYRKTVYYYLMDLADDNPPIPNREAGEDFENLWLIPTEAKQLLTHEDSKEILTRTVQAIKMIE